MATPAPEEPAAGAASAVVGGMLWPNKISEQKPKQ